jgi:hypothetical protein
MQRVDDLVVQRRLRFLRQATDADADRVRVVQLVDARGRQDVDHARREAAVGDDADIRGLASPSSSSCSKTMAVLPPRSQ